MSAQVSILPSRELSLLPFDRDDPRVTYAHTVLACHTSPTLWEALARLPSLDVPRDFTSYLSRDGAYPASHYGVTTTDPYGEPLRTCACGDLAALAHLPGVTQHPLNRAVWAYLAALPPATRVALYWH